MHDKLMLPVIALAAVPCLAQLHPDSAPSAKPLRQAQDKPNVLVILTDDQGYGDLSCHGNPVLKTPALDKLHSQSVRFTDFHVAPICTPSRSQIMTGRDSLANGAYCVCSGHEFSRTDMPTMAEVFKSAGYRTALFGKWHLGDNYPYRPQDRGFQETLTFLGYGMGSTANRWDAEYMDPWLIRNGGKWERVKGYCTDIFFDGAMKWMKECSAQNEPFFIYLPTNTPHHPNQVPAKYRAPYAKFGDAAGFFGMIANIDENMARLDAFLKDNGLADNTIVVFMTDNGGTGGVKIFNAGMKGMKGQYFEGGHRVPCFIRWPAGNLRASRDVDTVTQSQDIFPTLTDLCGIRTSEKVAFDGNSLVPLLRNQDAKVLDDRMIVVQCALWDEYKAANKWAGVVLWGKWRLLGGKTLYDLRSDPAQKKDVAAEHAEIVVKMRAFYEQWWARTEPLARDFLPIVLGAEQAPDTVLTAHNWVAPNTADQLRDVRAGVNHNGPWHVQVAQAGKYEISLRRWPEEADVAIRAAAPAYKGKLDDYRAGRVLAIVKARLKGATVDESKPVSDADKAVVFQITLPAGRTTLQTWFLDKDNKPLCGAYYVYCRKLEQ